MPKSEQIILTPEGFLELEEELNELKLNRRQEVIQAIADARALGDLSENSEYHSAREEQAQVEARIRELEYKLEHATISDGKSNGKVVVGSTVLLEYIEDDTCEEYKIVGSLEVDPLNNKISNESPLGGAIIGKKSGDTVNVISPNGSFSVKIVKIA